MSHYNDPWYGRKVEKLTHLIFLSTEHYKSTMLVILLPISFQLSPNVGKQNRDKNKDESSFSICQMNACKIVNFLMVDETNFNSEGRGSLFFVFLSKMLN